MLRKDTRLDKAMNSQAMSGGPPAAGTMFVLPYVPGKVKTTPHTIDGEQRSQAGGYCETEAKGVPDKGKANATARPLAIASTASSRGANATAGVVWRENRSARRRRHGGRAWRDTRMKAKNVYEGLAYSPLQAEIVWLYIDHFQGSPSLQRHTMSVWFKGHIKVTIMRHLGAHAVQM